MTNKYAETDKLFVVSHYDCIWETPYKSLKEAKTIIEERVAFDGDDPTDFIIYELHQVAAPKKVTIEW